MTAPVAESGSAGLANLAERLDAQEGYAAVIASLTAGHGAALGGVWGSSCALVAANLTRHAPDLLVVVCPRAGDVDDFCDDLGLFLPSPAGRGQGEGAENSPTKKDSRSQRSPLTPTLSPRERENLTLSPSLDRFPAWERALGEGDVQDEAHGDRLRVLKWLSQEPSPAGRGQDEGAAHSGKKSSTKPTGPSQRSTLTPALSPREREQNVIPRSPLRIPHSSSSIPHSPFPTPHSNSPRLLVTSIQALLQPVPAPGFLASQTKRLKVGDEINPTALLRWMAENGFQNTSAVQLPGEFAPRGGIVDVFAPDWFHPVRIEFFGDTIESLRQFEVSTQRSLDSLDAIEITALPVVKVEQHESKRDLIWSPEFNRNRDVEAERDASVAAKKGNQPFTPSPLQPFNAATRSQLATYLPPRTWFLLIEPHEIQEEARHYRQRLERPQDVHEIDDTLASIYHFPSVTAAAVASGSMEAECQLRIESVERFSGDINKVRDELDTVGLGNNVHLVCSAEAEAQRLREVFGGTRLAAEGRLHFPLGRLQSGFRLVSDRIVLVSSSELFHRQELNRPTRRRLGRVIDSFLELREGDYVVHLSHGIGRYRGMKLLEHHGAVEEHLEVEFHGGTRIFVPASSIDLVQKYIGGSKAKPSLAHIGGRMWSRQKEAAEQAVIDLAADMLKVQAMRSLRPGIEFPADSEWQREFDSAFPYQETPDQLSAIAAIKHDMQQFRPMDRLLCGDVGFGKTEVAIRAAFKAVDAGYQVAVLVPTTILAEQHRRTFTQRMAEFPFRIDALSRFATDKQQRETIAGLIDGSVDIVIGTHRLAQADVNFHNLGLLVIDEEQRFGVEVKERLKALRATVDVLTMTATPIPRTLHLSLLGVRDIANLETPPEDRLAVETRVTRFDEELLRHAMMRELNRGGQAFFVHNRINDLDLLASKLQRIVPEARIRMGHGQMPEHQLEEVMFDFVNHKFDILLATTIVESGLDIPNANTIFIDEADKYGLADLHQLRGRVGRYKHRAYCYLLLDPDKYLSTNSAKRLRAIEEFSEMGAGFAIAMRDLEIRGAGNILGTQQSGHIATIGYELYCELLEQAVRKLKNMAPRETIDIRINLPGEAYIPRGYVPDMRMKIDLYRRLTRVTKRAELADLKTEMLDRFGPMPPPAARMVKFAELRVAAAKWQLESIDREEGYVVMPFASRTKIDELNRQLRGQLRIVENRKAYLPLKPADSDPEALLARIETLLNAG